MDIEVIDRVAKNCSASESKCVTFTSLKTLFWAAVKRGVFGFICIFYSAQSYSMNKSRARARTEEVVQTPLIQTLK